MRSSLPSSYRNTGQTAWAPTKTAGSLAFPLKHWVERSYGLTLGILANRPARVSRMLVISRISLSYNRIRTRKMRKDKGGRKALHDRAPRSCKAGLAQCLSLWKSSPSRNNAGREAIPTEDTAQPSPGSPHVLTTGLLSCLFFKYSTWISFLCY